MTANNEEGLRAEYVVTKYIHISGSLGEGGYPQGIRMSVTLEEARTLHAALTAALNEAD